MSTEHYASIIVRKIPGNMSKYRKYINKYIGIRYNSCGEIYVKIDWGLIVFTMHVAVGSLGLIYIPISKMAEEGNACSSTCSGYLGEPSELSADEFVLVEEREASAMPTILNRLKSPTVSDLASCRYNPPYKHIKRL